MPAFLIRRLLMALVTLASVMLLTFLLFGLTAGDVSAQFLPAQATRGQRQEWLRKHKLDLPLILNFNRQVTLTDRTSGRGDFIVQDEPGSSAASALGLEPGLTEGQGAAQVTRTLGSQGASWLDARSPLRAIAADRPWADRAIKGTPPRPAVTFTFHDGSRLTLDLSPLTARAGAATLAGGQATVGDLLALINNHPDNRGRLDAGVSGLSAAGAFNSQFFWHLRNTITFEGESFKYQLKLTDIIAERARYSLALTVPSLALGWLLAMTAASLVAYYRGGLVDRLGVLLCVVGMCVPILVYMIVGQSVTLELAPRAALGVTPWTNIYVPVAIAVAAGLGGAVRFYRTIMLNEVRQDYVRTALAKGAPLPHVLFAHVLKNCMLPILTSLVASVPFLILGSLVIEQFFGIPGLGSLVRTSVTDRDAPIMAAITFLTAAVYIVGLLVTDVLYALFDPRIRLR
ncbi:MAG: ABC transporter permease [Planctomycetota bacterium]|nr:ABC transporter permease [Planctomycetota bacterium]